MAGRTPSLVLAAALAIAALYVPVNAEPNDDKEMDNAVLKAYALDQEDIDEIARAIRISRPSGHSAIERQRHMRDTDNCGQWYSGPSEMRRPSRVSREGNFHSLEQSPGFYPYQHGQSGSWQQSLNQQPYQYQQGFHSSYPSGIVSSPSAPAYKFKEYTPTGRNYQNMRNYYPNVYQQQEPEILYTNSDTRYPIKSEHYQTTHPETDQSPQTLIPNYESTSKERFLETDLQLPFPSQHFSENQHEAPLNIEPLPTSSEINCAENPVIVSHAASDCSDDFNPVPMIQPPSNFLSAQSTLFGSEESSGSAEDQPKILGGNLLPDFEKELFSKSEQLQKQPMLSYPSPNAINKFGSHHRSRFGLRT